jgi:hypothetical protein
LTIALNSALSAQSQTVLGLSTEPPVIPFHGSLVIGGVCPFTVG